MTSHEVPTTPAGAIKKYDLEPDSVRAGKEGVEVTSKGAGKILDMKASSVRRRHYLGDIQGAVAGRDLWLSLESVIKYKKTRKAPGRPVETGAGLGRKRPTKEGGKSRAASRPAASKKSGKKAAKKAGKASKKSAGAKR